MAEKKLPATLLQDCGCGRLGYMLVLCEVHAPIPFELTDRGRRTARHMRQWDAIYETLEDHRRERKVASRRRA